MCGHMTIFGQRDLIGYIQPLNHDLQRKMRAFPLLPLSFPSSASWNVDIMLLTLGLRG